MASSELSIPAYWRDSSSAQVDRADTEPDGYNFLSFIATAQALDIEFLPLIWDAAREGVGIGGTSRINQTLLTRDTSFAFKIYRQKGRTEENVFRTLVTEIAVLSHRSVREHPNIAQLQGICWDISSSDDKPWPVLVFEKSHLGDLRHFVKHGGREMKICERLRLGLDIGKAVMDMHSNSIVHGDIKPENVLVFGRTPEECSARVIDFGYSSQYINDDQRLTLPRSEPWNAPENTGRRALWTPLDALKSDLFCFGILLFWLLFETSLSETAPLQKNHADTSVDTVRKLKGDLQKHALHFLASETALNDDEKMALQDFFQSSLSRDPTQREASCLQKLLGTLKPQSKNEHVNIPSQEVKDSIHIDDFKIEKSIREFYSADYRVRSHIFQCLSKYNSKSPSIEFELAYCYYIGFGVMRDEAKAKTILNQNEQTIQTIESEIANLQMEHTRFQPGSSSELRHSGYVLWTDSTYLYFKQEKLREAEKCIEQERNDLIEVLGDDHALPEMLGFMLARIYTIQGRLGQSKELEERGIETCKKIHGDDGTPTLTGKIHLASIYRKLNLWKQAKDLETQVLTYCTSTFESSHPDLLTTKNNLASTLAEQGEFKEAQRLFEEVADTSKNKFGSDHPFTLTSMSNLASMYGRRGRLADAKKLELEVMETFEKTLGSDHLYTLTSKANTAMMLSDHKQWKEAEELLVSVMGTYKTKYEPDHLQTMTVMQNLAYVLFEQGRWDDAGKLEEQVLQLREEKLGDEHSDTLWSMHNLARTWKKQGKHSEAIGLMSRCYGISSRVFGPNYEQTRESRAALIEWRISEIGVWLFAFPGFAIRGLLALIRMVGNRVFY